MNINKLVGELAASWSRYGTLVIAGVVVLMILAGLIVWKTGRSQKLLVFVAFATALAINAEGMWVVATQKLHLVPSLAGGVFFVFEAILVTEMSLAGAQYRRTTIRDDSGVIVTPGHPGKHGRTVWLIAVVSGVIVAFNAKSWVEVMVRLAIPLAVTLLWWNSLTSEGTGRPTSRLAISPVRLAERWGWLVPAEDDADLKAMIRKRRIRAMVIHAHRLETGVPGAWWHTFRLTRLARTADEGMGEEVAAQLDRATTIVSRVVPSRRPGTPGGYAHRADVGQVGSVPTTGRSGQPGIVPAEQVPALPVTPPQRPAIESAPSGHAGEQEPGRHAEDKPRLTREEALDRFGEQLVAEWLASPTGAITEYRVRAVTGLAQRPGKWVHEQVAQRVAERQGDPMERELQRLLDRDQR